MRLNLPIPPSVNGMFANVHKRGRVKVQAYRNYEQAAALMIASQNLEKISGKVNVDITVQRLRKNTGDIDNKIKAALDSLVKNNLIDDDRHVQQITARWGDVDGCLVIVEAA